MPANHGSDFQSAKREFMENSINDWRTPGHISGWLKQEQREHGSGYWHNPPGYDVGHSNPNSNDPSSFRWENSDMNRARGGSQGR